MHVRVVEEVALQSPGLAQHLGPLVARVDPHRPGRELDARILIATGRILVRFGGAHRAGLDAEEPFLGAIDENLVVRRDVEADHILRQGRQLLVGDVVGQERAALRRAVVLLPGTLGRHHAGRLDADPVELPFDRLEAEVEAGRHRHLHAALAQAVEIDPDRSDHLILFLAARLPLGVLVPFSASRTPRVLAVPGILLSRFRLIALRVDVSARGERQLPAGLQRHDHRQGRLLHDEAGLEPIEIRIDVAIGKEEEVLPFRVPGGEAGVEHRVAHRVRLPGLRIPDPHLAEAVVDRQVIGKIARVGRPFVVGDLELAGVGHSRRPVRRVGHHQPELLIAPGQPLAVGGEDRAVVPARLLRPDLPRRRAVVRRVDQQLFLSIHFRPGGDRRAIRRERRVLGARQAVLGEASDETLLPGARDEQIAARLHDDPFAVLRQPPAAQVGHRVDEALPHLQAIARQRDRHDLVAARNEVIGPEIHLVLVDDLAVAHGRPADVVIVEAGVTLDIGAVRLHRSEVRPPPAIGDEVDSPVRAPHREGILAVVGGRLLERQRVEGSDVDLLRLASPVPLPVVELQPDLLVGDPLAARLEADPGGRLEGNEARDAALRRHGVGAEVGMRIVAAAAEQDLAVRRPADHLIGGGVVGQADRLAARGRHDIDVVVPFVLRREGDAPTVGGDLRELLLSFVGGQPQRHAARRRDLPEITLGGEDDHAAGDRRVTVEAVGGRLGGASRGRQGEKREERGQEAGGPGRRLQHGESPRCRKGWSHPSGPGIVYRPARDGSPRFGFAPRPGDRHAPARTGRRAPGLYRGKFLRVGARSLLLRLIVLRPGRLRPFWLRFPALGRRVLGTATVELRRLRFGRSVAAGRSRRRG